MILYEELPEYVKFVCDFNCFCDPWIAPLTMGFGCFGVGLILCLSVREGAVHFNNFSIAILGVVEILPFY